MVKFPGAAQRESSSPLPAIVGLGGAGVPDEAPPEVLGSPAEPEEEEMPESPLRGSPAEPEEEEMEDEEEGAVDCSRRTWALLFLCALAVLGIQVMLYHAAGHSCLGREAASSPMAEVDKVLAAHGYTRAQYKAESTCKLEVELAEALDKGYKGRYIPHDQPTPFRPCRHDRSLSWEFEYPRIVMGCWVNLAFVARCVVLRRVFRSTVPLHVWTRRYAACAASYAAYFLYSPARHCHGLYYFGIALGLLHNATYMMGPYVLARLLFLKLTALRRPGVAKALHTSFFPIAAISLAESAFSWLTPQLFSFSFPIVTALCWVGWVGCAVWGLLAGAALAARSRSARERRVACWVHLTAAVLVLTSAASLAVLVLFHNIRALWWAVFIDTLFNCFSVALLSGLVGPRDVRQLAAQAFEKINSHSVDRLQELYLSYLEYLDEAEVKWVRCRYLRQLARDRATMVRCQDVPLAEMVIGSEGFPPHRDLPKHRFVLSHPWLSKAHPDPNGVKLRILVEQLDLLDADDLDAVFIDFMSLPQNNKLDPYMEQLEQEGKAPPRPGEHPAVRTEAEEVLFKKALSSMEKIYSVGSTPVIAIPMNDALPSGMQYITRGWCYLEFCLAASFNNIANADLHQPTGELRAKVIDLRRDTIQGFRQGFKETHFTSKGDGDVVLRLFENTVNAKAAN